MQELELSKSEKINLGTTEIAKRIRQELKKFEGCKFSIRTEYYSMGSSIHINLMEANFKVIKDFKDIEELALFRMENESIYKRQDIEERQKKRHHQLNQVALRQDYNSLEWCNGVFLTKEGHELLREVVKIADRYNYDDSEPMTDYYSVNFSLSINIGKWDKPFIEVRKWKTKYN